MKKLWGGRFKKKTDPLVEDFTKSIHYDYKIAKWDILNSMIQVDVLKNRGYLSKKEALKLVKGLSRISKKVEEPGFKLSSKNRYEDIHTYIQHELQKQKEVGDLALKLHTARSRNDQVVFATKLYCKMNIRQLEVRLLKLETVIANLANSVHKESIIIPGFTHMQHAQPVFLADYIWTYVHMLERDCNRLNYICENIKVTIGSGALAGTPITIDEYSEGVEKFFKKDKEFRKFKKLFNIEVTSNSLDSVSDRDFVIEIISALSIIAMHLSRLAEDLIIWATKEFGFVEIDEAFCTGSSLMPQKKNPDVLELVRGYAGRLYGNLVNVLTMMKGLPLTYNRDMQLDKEPLFDSFELVSKEIDVLAGLIKTLKFNKPKIEEHLKDESLYATDLVYYLVDKKVPFKEAHTIVGKIISYCVDHNIEIKNLAEDKLKQFSKKFVKNDINRLFDPIKSVLDKRSIKRERRKLK